MFYRLNTGILFKVVKVIKMLHKKDRYIQFKVLASKQVKTDRLLFLVSYKLQLIHSERRLVTGFAMAALIAWELMVTTAINSARTSQMQIPTIEYLSDTRNPEASYPWPTRPRERQRWQQGKPV